MQDDKSTLIVTTDDGVSDLPVSMQVYQAIYNDITGKTEKITDTYNRFYEVCLADITNLERRIAQFCEQYHIKADNASITIYHIKGSKERFSSFERLNTYNVTNTSAIERINIELNFIIVLPKANKPQSYSIKITLGSGVAILEKHENEFPKELPIHLLVRTIQKDTAEVAIEYVDYVVARGISELFREWIESLPEQEASKFIEWFQSVSHLIRQLITLLFFLAAGFFSIFYVDTYLLPASSDVNLLARYLLYAFFGVSLSYAVGRFLGHRVERAIDRINSSNFSMIRINSGDQKLNARFKEKAKKSTTRAVFEGLVSFVVGIASSLAAALFIG